MATTNVTSKHYPTLEPNRHGFITHDSAAAHDELVAAGWQRVSNDRAADPAPPPGALALYAKGPRLAWLLEAPSKAEFRQLFAALTQDQRAEIVAMADGFSSENRAGAGQ